MTYIKYVRALKTEDAISDACISDDQAFNVIYALGQGPANYEHIPGSALETIGSENAYNPRFYKDDELKFHGGGIGSGSDRRGRLGSSAQLNLFMDAAAASGAGDACTVSTLAPEYDCQLEFLGGDSIIHYKAFVEGDAGAQIAAEAPREGGWIAFGFHPEGSPRMPGSSAVIATETAQGGSVGVFDLNAYAASGVVEAVGATGAAPGRRKLLQSSNVPFTITDVRLFFRACSAENYCCCTYTFLLQHTFVFFEVAHIYTLNQSCCAGFC